jgi:hypothetical protein
LQRNAFSGLNDDFEVHFMLWGFVSVSYWNTHDSSPVKIQPKNWDYLDKSGRSLRTMSPRCFCLSVRLYGTNLTQIFLFPKSSRRIWWIVSLLMFSHRLHSESHFHWHLRLRIHFERLKDTRSLDHPEDPHARL